MTKFWSYSKASLRLWRRQWVGVFVAVAGLAVAFAVTIISGLYLYDGVRSDAWLTDASRLYRVTTETIRDGEIPSSRSARSQDSVAPNVLQYFSEIEEAVRLRDFEVQYAQGDIEFLQKIVFADEGFTKIFPLRTLRGQLELAFAEPGAIALSWTEAQKFGGLDAVGTVIQVVKGQRDFSSGELQMLYDNPPSPYKIVAIYADLPPNTHLILPAVALFVPSTRLRTFHYSGDAYTYLKLAVGMDFAAFEKRFTDVISAKIPLHRRRHITSRVFLEPVLGMQYKTKSTNGLREPVQNRYLWVLGVISAVLLLTSGFNFATIFTAIYLQRGKEMAMRRTAGAGRAGLYLLGIGEGIFMALVAVGFSVLIALNVVPLVVELTGSAIAFVGDGRIEVWLSVTALACVFGILSVSYPALVMSKARPIDLFREAQGSIAGSKGRLKQALVGLQALVFVATALGASQIFYQIDYLNARDKGYRTDDIFVLVAPPGQEAVLATAFRSELLQVDGVQKAAATGFAFLSSTILVYSGKKVGAHGVETMFSTAVSKELFALLDVKIVAELSGDWSRLSNPIAILEEDLTKFSFSSAEEALGQIIERNVTTKNDDGTEKTEITPLHIVAVMPHLDEATFSRKDIPHIYDLKQREPEDLHFLTVRADLSTYSVMQPAIKTLWEKHFGDTPFKLERYDEKTAAKYEKDLLIGQAVLWVAVLTAVLGVAGLYGMATHWLSTRERELALRRVLGASRSSVVQLAMQKMLLPVGLGASAALVPTWYGVQQWAENFTDFAGLGAHLYVVAVFAALVLAGLLLFLQVQRALRKRPAHVLYHE